MVGEMIITANDVDVPNFAFSVFAAGLPLEYNFAVPNVGFVSEWRTFFGGYEVRFSDPPVDLVPGDTQFSLASFGVTTTGPLRFLSLNPDGSYFEAATATLSVPFSYTSNISDA